MMSFPLFVSKVFKRINKMLKQESARAEYNPQDWNNFYGFCYVNYGKQTVGRLARMSLNLIKNNRI